MRFRNIRGDKRGVAFRDALMEGISTGGSLYIPEEFPILDPRIIEAAATPDPAATGFEVLSKFIDDMPTDNLRRIAGEAFNFPVPLVSLDDSISLLELFHGPTLAFKDFGARFMAGAMDYFLGEEERNITVIVATSGDTGSAVAQGFFGKRNISVYILYPSGKISPLQERQMTTLGGNIHAVEVGGTFDDCQRLVKQALADSDLVRKRSLTTANSINPGRLLPQISYYVSGYAQWKVREGNGTLPLLVIPSGNFGNLTAALYAGRMGIRAAKYVAATNGNDVVPEYFRTGIYTPRASKRTYSNAMDVGDPNNLSRIEAMYDSDISGMRKDITAMSVGDAATLDEIRSVYEKTGYILDPHTAVGVSAARSLIVSGGGEKAVVAATAHPAKFPEVIREALGIEIELPDALRRSLDLPKRSTKIEPELEEVKRLVTGGGE